jgi:hypothetical protein
MGQIVNCFTTWETVNIEQQFHAVNMLYSAFIEVVIELVSLSYILFTPYLLRKEEF